MHIHGNLNTSQPLPLNTAQGTLRSSEAKQAALTVKKKLTDFAATADNDVVSHVGSGSGSQAESNPRQKKSQPDPENFRSTFFSFTV